MRKLNLCIVSALIVCTASMVGIHWQGMQIVQQKVSQLEDLAERQSVTGSLLVGLEKYRRQSRTFLKLSSADHNSIKTKLTTDINDAVARLESLGPTSEEQALGTKATQQIAEFMVLTAKLEPWLFTKDVFQKPEASQLFESMSATISQLKKSADSRASKIRSEAASAQPTSLNLLVGISVAILFLVGIVLFRNNTRFARPIAALRARALELQNGKLLPEHNHTLKGEHAEIEGVMTGLAHALDKQRKERAQFITAVASDLRAPLVSLQAGAHLIASVGDRLSEAQRAQAAESVSRSVFRLSRSLEDLTDIVDLERTDIRLDEKIVDLRDMVSGVSKMLGGGQSGSTHEVTVSPSSIPVWTLIDPARFERVLVNLVSKMMQYQPQGGRIDVAVTRPSEGKFRGVEILIQDGQRLQAARAGSVGPEKDLLRHWVAENGFGMALAQKIVKSHGGSITASGVVGSSVLFTIRIPQERVAAGLAAQTQEAPKGVKHLLPSVGSESWIRTAERVTV